MNFRHIKITLLSLIGICVFLIPTAISGETSADETSEKTPTPDTKSKVITVPKYSAAALIINELINPIILQRKNRILSIENPTHSKYELVEVTESATKESRIFHIIQNNIRRNIITGPNKLGDFYKVKVKDIIDSSKTLHEVKYLNELHSLLIKQGKDWVAVKDHNSLKLLPQPVKNIEDAAVYLITNELLKPIIQQSNNPWLIDNTRIRPFFSEYRLAEVTESATKEFRIFRIACESPKHLKRRTNQTSTMPVYEVKYLNDSHKLLVKQNNEWVAIKDHNLLRRIFLENSRNTK